LPATAAAGGSREPAAVAAAALKKKKKNCIEHARGFLTSRIKETTSPNLISQ